MSQVSMIIVFKQYIQMIICSLVWPQYLLFNKVNGKNEILCQIELNFAFVPSHINVLFYLPNLFNLHEEIAQENREKDKKINFNAFSIFLSSIDSLMLSIQGIIILCSVKCTLIHNSSILYTHSRWIRLNICKGTNWLSTNHHHRGFVW